MFCSNFEHKKGWGPEMIAYLPMTKAAIRGLDTIESFIAEEYKIDINGFFVAGGSKRGWVRAKNFGLWLVLAYMSFTK